MKFDELSKEEQEIILKMRLDKINLDIESSCCKITGTILTKDENKVALAIEDKYADKQILVTLSDNHINKIYSFIRSRYSLCKKIDDLNKESKVGEIIEPRKAPF